MGLALQGVGEVEDMGGLTGSWLSPAPAFWG